MDLNFTDKELYDGGIFIMLVGPPGSGKTKFARNVQRDYANFKIISPNDIRIDMFGEEYDAKNSIELYEKVYSDIELYLNEHYNIVYDSCNCRVAYRRKMVDFLKSTNLVKKLICVLFSLPKQKCLLNNANRPKKLRIPENIIENMWVTLKKHPPIIFEGYDVIFNAEGLH